MTKNLPGALLDKFSNDIHNGTIDIRLSLDREDVKKPSSPECNCVSVASPGGLQDHHLRYFKRVHRWKTRLEHVPSRHFVRQTRECQLQDGNPKESSRRRQDQLVSQMVWKDIVLRDLLRTHRTMWSSHAHHPTEPQAPHFSEVNPQEAYPRQTDTWGLHFVSSITPDENVWIDI